MKEQTFFSKCNSMRFSQPIFLRTDSHHCVTSQVDYRSQKTKGEVQTLNKKLLDLIFFFHFKPNNKFFKMFPRLCTHNSTQYPPCFTFPFPVHSNFALGGQDKHTTACYLADVTCHLFAVFRNIKAVNRKFFHWGECDDQHQDCVTWASKGLCDEEPEKMHSWCPWSCHKCAPELMGKYLRPRPH